MKDYDKIKQSLYLKYCDVNNVYGLAVLEKLPAGLSHLSVSQKATIEIVIKKIFLSLMLNIQKNCLNFIMIYRLNLKE